MPYDHTHTTTTAHMMPIDCNGVHSMAHWQMHACLSCVQPLATHACMHRCFPFIILVMLAYLQEALLPLKRMLASRSVDAVVELNESEARLLQEHALVELLSNNVPPIRLCVLRTLQIKTGSEPVQCQYPGCRRATCQGNRIEINTDRLYEQPLSSTTNASSHAGSRSSSSHLQVTPAAVDFFEQLEPRAAGGGLATSRREDSGNTGGSEDGYQTAGETDSGSLPDAMDAGAAGSCGSQGGADKWAATGTSGLVYGAPRCEQVQGRWCVSRIRIVCVHHKTEKSHAPISIPLPFSLARSLLWYIMHARPMLMAGLGGAYAHKYLLVVPGSGRPMRQAHSMTSVWRDIQVKHVMHLLRHVAWHAYTMCVKPYYKLGIMNINHAHM
jgi:hypothetical protein